MSRNDRHRHPIITPGTTLTIDPLEQFFSEWIDFRKWVIPHNLYCNPLTGLPYMYFSKDGYESFLGMLQKNQVHFPVLAHMRVDPGASVTERSFSIRLFDQITDETIDADIKIMEKELGRLKDEQKARRKAAEEAASKETERL